MIKHVVYECSVPILSIKNQKIIINIQCRPTFHIFYKIVNFTYMPGLKFDKKSNKSCNVAVFHTFWPKLTFVIREPLF